MVQALEGRPIDKTAIQKMKLLDSVMKETQRVKPMQIGELAAVWLSLHNKLILFVL